MSTNRDERAQRMSARAAEILQQHTYTALVNTDQVQVWRCQKPGTSCYAFDILITRFGIAIVGDISNLTFEVGSSYGINFLAGDDIGYYIHSKLSQAHRKEQLNLGTTKELLCYPLGQLIGQWPNTPEWIRELDDGSEEDFDRLNEWLDEHWIDDEAPNNAMEVHEAVAEIGDLNDSPEHAYHIIGRHEELLELGGEWYEFVSTEPSNSLMYELYLINHAAKQIKAQMQQEEANLIEGELENNPLLQVEREEVSHG